MDINKLPLWSAFAFVTLISFAFLTNPAYDLNYISGFNLIMWCFCGLIYSGEIIYKKIRCEKWE